MNDSPGSRWHRTAHALALTPYEPTMQYRFGASFREVKRLLGLVAWGLPPDCRHYLYGRRLDTEVLVHTCQGLTDGLEGPHTAVMARIDPPLFLGITISSSNFADRAIGEALVRTADGKDALKVHGFDVQRVRALLYPRGWAGQAAFADLCTLRNYNLEVSDSVVRASVPGVVTDDSTIGRLLHGAIHAAQWLSRQRSRLPLTPRERELHDQWHRFAVERDLTFDPSRLKLTGKVGESWMEFAVETDGRRVSTGVTANFPHPVPVAFSVGRTGVPGLLQSALCLDVEVGDAEFDRKYHVAGHPQAHVRELLGKPELLAHLKRLGEVAAEVHLNERGMSYRLDDYVPTANDLAWCIDGLRAASEAFFGVAKSFGPYR
jgi:hypothetical protein